MHHMTLTMCPYSPCVNTLLVQPLSNHLNSKGRLLQRPAAGSFDGSVFVWELAGGTVAATLRGSGTSPVLGAAWSPQVPSVHSWHTLPAYCTARVSATCANSPLCDGCLL